LYEAKERTKRQCAFAICQVTEKYSLNAGTLNWIITVIPHYYEPYIACHVLCPFLLVAVILMWIPLVSL
jgi:hypothetical protein